MRREIGIAVGRHYVSLEAIGDTTRFANDGVQQLKKDKKMARIWSRPLDVSDLDGPDYWDYFGGRLVEHADIQKGARVLDVGCGTGSSLFPAANKTGERGYAIGIDICPA